MWYHNNNLFKIVNLWYYMYVTIEHYQNSASQIFNHHRIITDRCWIFKWEGQGTVIAAIKIGFYKKLKEACYVAPPLWLSLLRHQSLVILCSEAVGMSGEYLAVGQTFSKFLPLAMHFTRTQQLNWVTRVPGNRCICLYCGWSYPERL